MTGNRQLKRIIVARVSSCNTRGLIVGPGLRVPCALGRGGIRGQKREGDGATPASRLAFVAVLYRPDRVVRPATRLPTTALDPNAGWCDDPRHQRYNRAVRLPFKASHERLWRADRLYDIIVVLDHNLIRPKRGAGSAIFLHIATPDFSPTEGCIAVSMPVMHRILARSRAGTYLDIG